MRLKTAGLILLAILASLIPLNHSAVEYNMGEYVIESCDIDMVVNENNILSITEKIGVDFKVEKHGITRKIPLRNTVTRLDGTTTRNVIEITDINVNDSFETNSENGFKVIKIGSADRTMTGRNDYTISYLYNMGKDPGKDFDELYFDLIGDQWDTTIKNITFRIQMPKAFDPSKLGFSYGPSGYISNSDVYWTVDGNVISGAYIGVLYPGEALTVRLELPEGYFVNAGLGVDWVSLVPGIISIAFVLIVFLIWLNHGKDDMVVETVEFYPPGGYNSAEIGFYYKGMPDRKDIASLLIYLANKGYLKIIDDSINQSSSDKGKGFRLIQLKEYNGDNEIERIFLEGLFKDEGSFENLHGKFYKTINRIAKIFNTNAYVHKIFEKNSLKKDFPIISIIIAVILLINTIPGYEYRGIAGIFIGSILSGIAIGLCSLLFGKASLLVKIYGVTFGIILGVIPWVSMVMPALLIPPVYLITYIIGIICVIFLILFMKLMPRRNPYGTEILGKIKGFKTFLEAVEKPQLEALVMEEPSYFYDILPYTYVLGISDKWIKKFEYFTLSAPDWYTGRSVFDYSSFRSFTERTLSSVSSSMSSSSSSRGSGGSGGGSSGGGSGGGGGSSW